MGCFGSKYVNEWDDYDWKELPDNIKAAAKTLGFTKSIWDKDGKAPSEENEWEELTKEQQAAATTMGYTETTWNAS